MTVSTDDYEDDYDEYYDDEEGVSGFVVLVVALVVLVVFFAVVWFAYQRGIQDGTAMPVVAANPEPARTEQAVSFDDENGTNREVYDTLEGNSPTRVVVDASSEADPLAGFDQTRSASNSIIEADNPTNEAAEDVSEEGTPAQTAAQNEPAPREAAVPIIQTPVSQPATTAEEPVNEEPQSSNDPIATTLAPIVGTHVVQVGALRSEAEALSKFESIQAKMGSLLDGKSPDIQRADLGERGVFYRLRIAPFGSKSEAADYCTQLKQNGQDCLVKSAS